MNLAMIEPTPPGWKAEMVGDLLTAPGQAQRAAHLSAWADQHLQE